MGNLLGKLFCALLVFPPLYVAVRFVKWSWRSMQKEMKDHPEQ